MTVTSKWVALHEVSDYLAKGWREVQIIGGCDDAALMVSPEEPASEPAKVETVCQNCGENYFWSHARCCVKPAHPEPVAASDCERAKSEKPWLGEQLASAKAQNAELPEALRIKPEPVAAEMPEAVEHIIQRLRYEAQTQLTDSQAWRDNRKRLADNLDSWWRTHAAQPAKVRMTEELEHVLRLAGELQKILMSEGDHAEARHALSSITAVRAQSAEAGEVRLPKVREFLAVAKSGWFSGSARTMLDAALAELDAVEGRRP